MTPHMGVCHVELFELGMRLGNLEMELQHDSREAMMSVDLLGSAFVRVEKNCGIDLTKPKVLADVIEKKTNDEEFEEAHELVVALHGDLREILPRR